MKARCKKHNHLRPCKLCLAYRASCGGRARSEKKTLANRQHGFKARVLLSDTN